MNAAPVTLSNYARTASTAAKPALRRGLIYGLWPSLGITGRSVYEVIGTRRSYAVASPAWSGNLLACTQGAAVPDIQPKRSITLLLSHRHLVAGSDGSPLYGLSRVSPFNETYVNFRILAEPGGNYNNGFFTEISKFQYGASGSFNTFTDGIARPSAVTVVSHAWGDAASTIMCINGMRVSATWTGDGAGSNNWDFVGIGAQGTCFGMQNSANGGNQPNVGVGVMAVWDRALSVAECLLLSADPFAPIRPKRSRALSPSGSAIAALAAASE